MSAEIHPLGDAELHFWLTRSVARVMGLNLSEAMDQDALSVAGYRDLVTRCRMCPRVAECQQWLGQPHESPDNQPTHCVNCARLTQVSEALKPQ